MKKILIAGCGELGSRFLQAAISLNNITHIDIVEPGEKAKETANKRMLETGRDMSTVTVKWFSDFDHSISSGDMAVIATQADIRLEVFKQVLSLGYRYFLVEKIVTQSEKDYEEMIVLAKVHEAKVWVNCKTRNYPVWEYIKSKIDPSEKITYHSVGGNHGICTNGLHTIDLFVFLTSAAELKITNTRFDDKLHLTKRGKYDISGLMEVENMFNNSTLVMEYESSHTQMPVDLLFTKNYRWMVDNSTRQAFESDLNGQKQFIPVLFEGDLSVSVMAKVFIANILQYNTCELPTLEDCFIAHKAMFDASLPLFNKLLNKNDDNCPVT